MERLYIYDEDPTEHDLRDHGLLADCTQCGSRFARSINYEGMFHCGECDHSFHKNKVTYEG